MRATEDRPIAVGVIGWGAIAIGVLMLLSGALGAFVSSQMPDAETVTAADTSRSAPPAQFVFRHFAWFASGQVVLALVLVSGGRALLRLRKWGANVVLAFCIGLLAYALVFTAYFVYAAGDTPGKRAAEVAAALIVGGVLNLLIWGIPLVITIRRLVSPRLRAALH